MASNTVQQGLCTQCGIKPLYSSNIRCIYCIDCRQELRKKHRVDRYHSRSDVQERRAERASEKYQTKHCLWCGKEFTAARGQYDKASGIKTKNQRYCDRACSNQGRWERPHDVKTMSPTECAYLAAFIDGEGTVSQLRPRKLSADPLFPGRSVWRVTIANTHLGSLEWCIATTGVGTITKKQMIHSHYKQGYVWACHASKARLILEQILPYMIIKRDKAIVAIEDLKCLESRSVPRKS